MFYFHLFKGNRKHMMHLIENELEKRGLLRVTTSILCHSRPEAAMAFQVSTEPCKSL